MDWVNYKCCIIKFFLYVIAISVCINVTFCIVAIEDRGVDVHERVDVESRQNDVVRSGKERHSYDI